MTSTNKNRPAADGLYQTPAGKLCKLVRVTKDEEGQQVAEMSYASMPYSGAQQKGDGFTLAQRAWHLLKRVA